MRARSGSTGPGVPTHGAAPPGPQTEPAARPAAAAPGAAPVPRPAPFPGWSPALLGALSHLRLALRRPARSIQPGQAPSPARGRGLEFAGRRPYNPGDDPSRLDWRVYARTGRYWVKEAVAERARHVTLLVDASASMAHGEGDANKGLYARRLAAALAWVAVAAQDGVRAFLLRDGQAQPLPPALGRAGAERLLQALGAAREEGGTALAQGVAAALAALGPRARGPAVLVSDLLDPTWEEALRLLGQAAGEGAALQVLAPDEWDPPLGDEVELEDAETGQVRLVRLGPAEVAAYRRRLLAHVAAVRALCHRLGLCHVALDTGRPWAQVVLTDLVREGVLA